MAQHNTLLIAPVLGLLAACSGAGVQLEPGVIPRHQDNVPICSPEVVPLKPVAPKLDPKEAATYPVLSVDTRRYNGTTYLAVPSKALGEARHVTPKLNSATRKAWLAFAKRLGGNENATCVWKANATQFEAYDAGRRSTLRVDLCDATCLDVFLRCVRIVEKGKEVIANIDAKQRRIDAERARQMRFLDLDSSVWLSDRPWWIGTAPREVIYCDGSKILVAAASAPMGFAQNRAVAELAKALFPGVKVKVRGNTIETVSGAVLRGIQPLGTAIIGREHWALVGCSAACIEQSQSDASKK